MTDNVVDLAERRAAREVAEFEETLLVYTCNCGSQEWLITKREPVCARCSEASSWDRVQPEV